MSLFYGIGILVVGFCHTFPFAIELQKQQEVCEVDSAAPSLFENAYYSYGLLNRQNVDTSLEINTGSDGVDVVIEPIDRAVFQNTVENAEDDGIISEEGLGIFTVAFKNIPRQYSPGTKCYTF